MQYRQLGDTDLEVSRICLGTMMYGSQVAERDAHAQLDYAVSQGVNFIDTAEMYAVPPQPETQGLTEQYIGNWLAKRGDRDRLIVASKVLGRSEMTWVRGKTTRLDREQIVGALDASLERLQTDYIDLYQLHWPDRPMAFGGPHHTYEHVEEEDAVPLEETLAVLDEQVRAGKIRYVGLSNETPWGLHRCLTAAAQQNLPRVVSVQNAYSLLNRMYETGMAEFYHREGVGLLAYSPLGQGVLTGKYLGGAEPPGTRKALYHRMDRYEKPNAEAAVAAYVTLARERGLDPAQMALAFVNARPFVVSNIIGASTLAQLEADIASIDITLDDDVLAAIDDIHRRYPSPCP